MFVLLDVSVTALDDGTVKYDACVHSTATNRIVFFHLRQDDGKLTLVRIVLIDSETVTTYRLVEEMKRPVHQTGQLVMEWLKQQLEKNQPDDPKYWCGYNQTDVFRDIFAAERREACMGQMSDWVAKATSVIQQIQELEKERDELKEKIVETYQLQDLRRKFEEEAKPYSMVWDGAYETEIQTPDHGWVIDRPYTRGVPTKEQLQRFEQVHNVKLKVVCHSWRGSEYGPYPGSDKYEQVYP